MLRRLLILLLCLPPAAADEIDDLLDSIKVRRTWQAWQELRETLEEEDLPRLVARYEKADRNFADALVELVEGVGGTKSRDALRKMITIPQNYRAIALASRRLHKGDPWGAEYLARKTASDETPAKFRYVLVYNLSLALGAPGKKMAVFLAQSNGLPTRLQKLNLRSLTRAGPHKGDAGIRKMLKTAPAALEQTGLIWRYSRGDDVGQELATRHAASRLERDQDFDFQRIILERKDRARVPTLLLMGKRPRNGYMLDQSLKGLVTLGAREQALALARAVLARQPAHEVAKQIIEQHGGSAEDSARALAGRKAIFALVADLEADSPMRRERAHLLLCLSGEHARTVINTRYRERAMQRASRLVANPATRQRKTAGLTDDALAALLPHMQALTHLDLGRCTQLTDAAMGKLATLPALSNLVLESTKIGDAGIKHLAASKLRALKLTSCKVTDSGIAYLARMPLTRLDLRGTAVGDDAAEIVGGLRGLKQLDIAYTRITGAGLRALGGLSALEVVRLDGLKLTSLASVGRWTALRELWLGSGATIGPGGFAPLANLRKLEVLSIGGVGGLDDAAMKHVGRLTAMRQLYLSRTSLTDAGLRQLGALTSLEAVYLSSSTGITGTGLAALAGATKLRALYLDRSPNISTDGLAAISKLRSLQYISLSNCPVSDAGLVHVAKLGGLTQLSLDGCAGITDKGVLVLAALKQLRSVSLNGTRVTRAGAEALAKAHGGRVQIFGVR